MDFKTGLDKTTFLHDIKTQSAVLHQRLIMGEAVKRLSTGYRNRHPEIPWTLIAGMHDKLIQGYDIVDLDQVWKTANQDVPDLLTWLEPNLPKSRQPTHSLCLSRTT